MRSLKTLILAIAASLCLGLGVTAFAATVEGKTTSDVNVRATGSTTGTLLGRLKKDAKVTIIAAQPGWYKIKQTAKPNIGFVSSDYVKVTKGKISDLGSTDVEDAPADEDVPDESGEEVLEGDEDVIILDEGDGSSDEVDMSADAEGELIEDEDVPDESSDDDVPDESGDDDVPDESEGDVPDESGSSSTSTSSFKISPKTLYAKSNVNIRSKPSSSGTKKGTVYTGESMTAVEYIKSGSKYNGSTVKGNWYRSDKGNFVSADYLSTTKPATTSSSGSSSSSNSSSGGTATSGTYVASSTVTKYSSPLTLATKKGSISSGSKVSVKKTYKDGSLYKTMKVSGTWYELSDGTFVQASGLKKS